MRETNIKSNSRQLTFSEKKDLKKILSTLKYIHTTAQLHKIVHELILIINRERTERGEKPAKRKKKTNISTRGATQVLEGPKDRRYALIARGKTDKPTRDISKVLEDTRERIYSLKAWWKHE